MEIKNLDRFRGKMQFTMVTESGEIAVFIGPKKYTGRILSDNEGYYVYLDGYRNYELFKLAGVVNKLTFVESVLGYTDDGEGEWPWMKSPDDILKVLVELDRLYLSGEPDTEEPKSMEMEMEHPSIEDIDFTPKKKHYSFNFTV